MATRSNMLPEEVDHYYHDFTPEQRVLIRSVLRSIDSLTMERRRIDPRHLAEYAKIQTEIEAIMKGLWFDIYQKK